MTLNAACSVPGPVQSRREQCARTLPAARRPRRISMFSAARLLVGFATTILWVCGYAGAADVTASRYDDARTGANLTESLLTADSVNPNDFGRLFAYDLSDRNRPGEQVEVYAQPLYVSHVGVPGKGLVNLVLVATTSNSVFAFDADGPKPGSDGVLWQRSLGTPPTMSDVWKNCTSPCFFRGNNIRGSAGIMSTPVIDRARGIVFLVARVLQPSGHVVYRLHALDLRTGSDRAGSPTEIRAQASGVSFDADVQNQRTGLALARGQIIISWGSYADLLPYHGWVMSYRYDDSGGFTQAGVFVTTPDGDTSFTCAVPDPAVTAAIAASNATAAAESAAAALSVLAGDVAGALLHASAAATAKAAAEAAALAAAPEAANKCAHGGIWMTGRAPAVDPDGHILLMVGNGRNDMSPNATRNFGNSLLKLDPFTLAVLDFFTPDNHLYLNAADLDVGGSGPMIIPESNLVVGGGKEGVMYVWRLDNLGKVAAGDPFVVQKFPAGAVALHVDTGNDMPAGAVIGGFVFSSHAGHIMAGPVYWPRSQSAGGSRLYNWSENSELRVYTVDPAAQPPITFPPVAIGPDIQDGHPGGILSLSARGEDANSGIVWAATYDASGTNVPGLGILGALNEVRPGILRAYSAESLKPLWNSEQNHGRDSLGSFAKFTPPTVANGRVYMATASNRLVVYGLLQHNYLRPPATVIPAVLNLLLDDD